MYVQLNGNLARYLDYCDYHTTIINLKCQVPPILSLKSTNIHTSHASCPLYYTYTPL